MADEDGRRRLGRRLVRRREELGMDRKTVAAESGLSYPYVAQIENGEREPSLRAMQALAGALSLPLSDLTEAVTAPPAPSAGGYHANPGFGASAAKPRRIKRSSGIELNEARDDAAPMAMMAEPPRSTGSRDRRYVMVQVMDVLEQLPPRERLAVLSDAQAQVMQDVVDDEVRRRS